MSGPTDGLPDRLARNCASAYLELARAMGRPWQRWDDAWGGDLGLPVAESPNNLTLLRGVDAAEVPGLLERAAAFFSGPGGGFEIWSAWPLPGTPAGFDAFAIPGMVLPPERAPRAAPPELKVREVDAEPGMRAVEALLISAFDLDGTLPGRMLDPRALDVWRIWLGTVDERPVATAASHVSDGLNGVYGVATAEDVRGRGYGEALTWAAVGAERSLPAALQASELGTTVYRRMGFEHVLDFTVWERPER
jgi:hypothetical protein